MKIKIAIAASLLLLPVSTTAFAQTTSIQTIKQESSATKYKKAMSKKQKQTPMTQSMVNQFNSGKTMNIDLFNKEFVKLVNKERVAAHAKPIVYNPKLLKGASIRAQEQANTNKISHIRPNGQLFNTVYTGSLKRIVKAENVAYTYYNNNAYTLVSEKYLAQKLYTLWKKSPSHHKNIINPKFKGTAVSFKYAKVNGKYTYGYAAQILNK
ncbi:CAP domain-containing protein [Macrococcoides caseolyticum]|uniref:CAP domain-containing protein n=1 Tax=Macrococcoides caseolyticum TaxID=69966 RepID=UPI001F350DCC|nr:CAP domain-containing protein [Macrococcus caseolyticus]MCE4957557.1 CAP domain-containing protein [Macrococcus caseolyticus]